MQIMEIFNFSNSEMRDDAIQYFRQHQRIIVYGDRSNIELCTSNFPTFKRDNLRMTIAVSRISLRDENCGKSYRDFKMQSFESEICE